MGFINTVLGTPLGFIIYFAYQVLNNYGLAIVAFALIVKIPLFPVMLMAHRNSIRLLQLNPALTLIKRRYAGDRDSLNEAQHELFTKEKYSPLLGIVPLLVQLFLVMGILQVMYNPLQHMLRLEAGVIDALIYALRSIYGTGGGFTEQLLVLEAFQTPANWPVFQSALYGFNDGGYIFRIIQDADLTFLNLNLGTTPSFFNPSFELIIVLLSGLAALSFCLVQNAISPGALSQGKRTNIGLTIFTVGLSSYFALALPVGVGLYWTVGNFAAIGVVILLNLLYPPKRLAAEALAHLQKANEEASETPEQLQEKKMLKKELRKREKVDVARFKTAKKQLVFYAISSGQYKFYKTIIDYLLEYSDIAIHYLTNDPNDAIFTHDNKKIMSYYIGQQKTISQMLRLDADIMVTTVPDLQSFHMKRSIVRDVEYIHTFHSSASTHLIYREKAFDRFDTIFCNGPHHVAELRRREELAKLPKRKLVKVGYGMFDQLAESYTPEAKNERPRILIAPSWQGNNIMESCIEPIIETLLGQGYELVVRPHPQFGRLFPERMQELVEKYSEYVSQGEVVFELDFSSNQSIFTSDLLITDWSAISYEFSYCTQRPCIFVNTPMKIMNPNYLKYGLEVLDITLRDKVGVSVDIGEWDKLKDVTSGLLTDKSVNSIQAKEILQQYLYNPGRSGEAGGKYLINRLK